MAEDPSAVETLVGDLERRLRADYRVVGETSARAALERLGCASRVGRAGGADHLLQTNGLEQQRNGSGDSELKTAGFAGGYQAALVARS